jgi:hypothetical protein
LLKKVKRIFLKKLPTRILEGVEMTDEDYPCKFYTHNIVEETEKAFFVYVQTNGYPIRHKYVWLPKSQLKSFWEGIGKEGYKIPAWLAKKKGLI